MARLHPLVQEAIKNKYWPQSDGEFDSSVLWVGDALDGISLFLPEINKVSFPHNDRPDEARRHLKSILNDTNPGDNKAKHYLVQDLSFLMRRPSWPRQKGQDTPPWVRLNDRLRTQTPGELMNSPQVVEDDEEGGYKLMMLDKQGLPTIPFDPIIREDKRYQLHLLYKGDEFTFSFTNRKKEKVSLRFVLRAISDGSSLVTPERSNELVSW